MYPQHSFTLPRGELLDKNRELKERFNGLNVEF